MILADSRQVAIRRSLLQVFCAYFAKYFTHPSLRQVLSALFYKKAYTLSISESGDYFLTRETASLKTGNDYKILPSVQ